MGKAKDFRDLSVEELKATVDEKRHQLFSLRNEFMAAKKTEKPHRLREFRRDIARLLTILTEKQVQNKQAGR